MEFVYEERHAFGRAVPFEMYADRRRALRQRLDAAGLSVAVVRGSASRYGDLAYLTNHIPPPGTVACLLLPAQGDVTLYADASRPELVAVERILPLAQMSLPESGAVFLGPCCPGLPAGAALEGALDEARMVKAPPERDVLADAAVVGTIGLEAALAMVLPGATERHVAAAAISAALRAGADRVRCAVRAGPWTELANRWPDAGDQHLESGAPVVIDLRGSYQGYRFRIARTPFVGRAETADRGAAAAADGAFQALVATLRPGASLTSACQAAEDAAARHGHTVDRYLGGGIGLDPAEPPLLQPGINGSVQSGLVLSLTIHVKPVLLVQTVAVDEGGAIVLGKFSI